MMRLYKPYGVRDTGFRNALSEQAVLDSGLKTEKSIFCERQFELRIYARLCLYRLCNRTVTIDGYRGALLDEGYHATQARPAFKTPLPYL